MQHNNGTFKMHFVEMHFALKSGLYLFYHVLIGENRHSCFSTDFSIGKIILKKSAHRLFIFGLLQANVYLKSVPKYFWLAWGSVESATRWWYCRKPTKTKFSIKRGINRSCWWRRFGRPTSSRFFPGENNLHNKMVPRWNVR